MTTIEGIPTMTATEYVVEVFKRTHNTGDIGQWERADSIREAVDRELEIVPGTISSGYRNDGSFKVIERLSAELDKAGIAENLLTSSIANYRNVAQAWPEQDRVLQASYDAHRELATKTYNQNRAKILRRLVERSSRGIVTRADVRTYKSEMKPKKSVPFDIRVERVIRHLFKGELRPAPNAVTEWGIVVGALKDAVVEANRELAAAKERDV